MDEPMKIIRDGCIECAYALCDDCGPNDDIQFWHWTYHHFEKEDFTMRDTADFFVTTFAWAIYAGYIFGPILGLYAAVTNGSFMNALLSVIIPWYGTIYWIFS